MQEIASEIFGEVRSALRFRWHGMLVAWLLCGIGWLWVLSLPDVYESNARVFVDTTSVLERVLGNRINLSEVGTQINYIREALLGRVHLETVIAELGLDADITNALQREALLERLRQGVTITSSGGNNRNVPDNVYSITYQNSDRATAVAVVRILLDAFVADTLGENRRSGETAEQFLDERVAEYEQRLGEAEAALAAFKRDNADRLPGAEGDYYQRMRSETDALANANRDLRLLQSKLAQLQAQLNSQSTVVAGLDPGSDTLPAGSLDARIRNTKTQLDLARLELTDRHPDVIALRDQLALLESQRAEQLAALGIDDTEIELHSLGANPVRQALQIDLNNTEVEIATLVADIQDRENRVRELQGLINELPQVEAQLVQLNRDYDVIYEQYLALVRSRENQELSLKASDTDQADFRIIDPPTATVNPVGPPRLAYYALVLIGALGAGAVLAYGCAQLWPVFGKASVLRAVTELPVLGTVTHAWQAKYQSQVRRSTAAYLAALAALVAIFGLLAGVESLGADFNGLLDGRL